MTFITEYSVSYINYGLIECVIINIIYVTAASWQSEHNKKHISLLQCPESEQHCKIYIYSKLNYKFDDIFILSKVGYKI